MPLPGGYSWLLTTEVGGYDCIAKYPQYWPDSAHQGKNYYSIDIDPSGSGYPTSVPVLAAAGGKVIVNADSGDYSSPNGNYIIIDHDGDGNAATGIQTWYLHLADVPKRKNGTVLATGSSVNQGDQIGIMGTTGHLNGVSTSTAVHLHFGVRHGDVDALTYPDLARVIMEWVL